MTFYQGLEKNTLQLANIHTYYMLKPLKKNSFVDIWPDRDPPRYVPIDRNLSSFAVL